MLLVLGKCGVGGWGLISATVETARVTWQRRGGVSWAHLNKQLKIRKTTASLFIVRKMYGGSEVPYEGATESSSFKWFWQHVKSSIWQNCLHIAFCPPPPQFLFLRALDSLSPLEDARTQRCGSGWRWASYRRLLPGPSHTSLKNPPALFIHIYIYIFEVTPRRSFMMSQHDFFLCSVCKGNDVDVMRVYGTLTHTHKAQRINPADKRINNDPVGQLTLFQIPLDFSSYIKSCLQSLGCIIVTLCYSDSNFTVICKSISCINVKKWRQYETDERMDVFSQRSVRDINSSTLTPLNDLLEHLHGSFKFIFPVNYSLRFFFFPPSVCMFDLTAAHYRFTD